MDSEIHFSTWDAFKANFRQHLAPETDLSDYVFRGHGQSDWKLEPTFIREFGHGRGDRRREKQLSELRNNLLENFLGEATLEGLNLSEPRNEPQKWALGQHYGLATPLLDWSSSPYVAAFFALHSVFGNSPRLQKPEAEALKGRVAIWALRRRGAEKNWEEMGVKLLANHDATNRRVRSQLGWFTLLPPKWADLEQCVNNYYRRRRVRGLLTKFSLPYSVAFEGLEDLLAMDITPRRLFGELEGVCRSAMLITRMQLY